MNEETFSLFWGGVYSQWANYPIRFKGIEFNCNEQMMMYAKAITFDDLERAREIMDNTSPREQKKLGRRVRNFNFDKWNLICNQVVYTANFCKFTQNCDCWIWLMDDTADTIVEASPYDKVWGIGLSENDPRAMVRNEWLGENRLGQMITDVRQYLCDPYTFNREHVKRVTDTCELFSLHDIL